VTRKHSFASRVLLKAPHGLVDFTRAIDDVAPQLPAVSGRFVAYSLSQYFRCSCLRMPCQSAGTAAGGIFRGFGGESDEKRMVALRTNNMGDLIRRVLELAGGIAEQLPETITARIASHRPLRAS